MSKPTIIFMAALGLALGVLCLGVPQTLGADGATAVLPTLVVKDSGGQILGPVIDTQGGNRVIVLLRDPLHGDPFMVSVFRSRMRTPDTLDVYYTGNDCTGTAYVRVPAAITTTDIPLMRGSTYAVGKNNKVYRATGAGSNNSMSQHSSWRIADNAAPVCNTPSSTTDNTALAEEVLDLASFPPPYSIE